jgi:hypothetical protein
MVVAFRIGSGYSLVRFVCSNLFMSDIDHYMCHKDCRSLRVYSIYGYSMGFTVLVVFYSSYYGTSHLQQFCTSWRERNHLLRVLTLNK